MLLSLIPASRPFPAVVDSLGFDDPLFVVALAGFAVLTLAVLLVAGRKAVGTDSESTENSSSSGSGSDADSDVPDESEWTVSYNPPSRRSSGSSSRSSSSGGSTGGRSASASSRSSSSPSSSSSSPSSSSSSPSSSSRSSRSSSSGSSSTGSSSTGGGATGSAGGTGDSSAQSAADGSGETRLYDPSDDDPSGTDTRIFTGEKDATQTCPDCEEPLPSGTDWEFCPFCGYEL